MKSLEIIDKRIKEITKQIELINPLAKRDIEYKVMGETLNYHIETLQQIKQDLEVLEIIYKKRITMEYLWFLYDYYKDFTNGLNYMLEKINEHQDETRKLTIEELLKLKQWLEENE